MVNFGFLLFLWISCDFGVFFVLAGLLVLGVLWYLGIWWKLRVTSFLWGWYNIGFVCFLDFASFRICGAGCLFDYDFLVFWLILWVFPCTCGFLCFCGYSCACGLFVL